MEIAHSIFMPNNKKNNIDTLAHCSVCQALFRKKDIITVEQQETRTVAHVTCFKCRTSTLLFFVASANGMLSVGMVTDLGRSEVKSKFGSYAISTDDVIAAHCLMEQYDKDIF